MYSRKAMNTYRSIQAEEASCRITAATANLMRASANFLERSLINSGVGFLRPFEAAATTILTSQCFALARLRGFEHLASFMLAVSYGNAGSVIECSRPLSMHGDNRYRADGVLRSSEGDALINLYCRAHNDAPRLDISIYDIVPNGKVSIDSVYYLGSDYTGGPGIHLDIGDSHMLPLKWLSHSVFHNTWTGRQDFLNGFVMNLLTLFKDGPVPHADRL